MTRHASVATLTVSLFFVLLFTSRVTQAANKNKSNNPINSRNNRYMRIASPLQTLTIPDRDTPSESAAGELTVVDRSASGISTPRRCFLPRFLAGLQAERAARKAFDAGAVDAATPAAVATAGNSENWAQRAAALDRARRQTREAVAERAFAQGAASIREPFANNGKKEKKKKKNPNAYQFVGVVQKASPQKTNSEEEKPAITWYARPKPADANWSVRLVHVNRQALLQDLYRRGKIDVFASYTNKGLQKAVSQGDEETENAADSTSKRRLPVVESTYTVRERSWKNVWNFSPKHAITDSSGMYWRERRLRPGLYTDGQTVYEASYRYRDGRNGMHVKSSLDQYLNSRAVSPKQKQRVLQRLQKADPDLVLEP